MTQSLSTKFVENPCDVASFLDDFHRRRTPTGSAPAPPITLYVDLEGINLSRNGSVSLLTLLMHQSGTTVCQTYIFDIHTLREEAFTTINDNIPPFGPTKLTLKSMFENEMITKVFFDVRNDSNALFRHFGIRLMGVVDLQLMENLSRAGGEEVKEKGKKLFAPEIGGHLEVFNKRSLNTELIAYCKSNVSMLLGRFGVYKMRVGIDRHGLNSKMEFVEWETEKRTKESQKKVFGADGEKIT
ncbi:hypothetical protein B0J14DRAFT_618744 [Halenospora varia]|nr:hypothetical protein B0J14DRAFT_618744 [Halenospora varia]